MKLPRNYLEKTLPILGWIKNYDFEKGVSDVVAGITVGLTLIPQSIAYASLAGLEPQYGLYSSLCGGIIYALFGTVPELSIAPTAILSLLTHSYIKNTSYNHVKAAILLCFISGWIELFCGILHLGFLTNFVSSPVVSAFTSAGAMTIASSQIKNLMSLKFGGEDFFTIWKNVFIHIHEYHMWDLILGLSCCAVLLLMRKLKDYGAPLLQVSPDKKSLIGKKLVWLLSVSKNALVVIGCAVLTLVLDSNHKQPFSLTGKVPTGFPNISLPPFQVVDGNKTITFLEMTSEIKGGLIFVPFIAILANVGIAKSFAQGKLLDASQEMVAVGLCNIVGSLFGSYPINASFSRAAVGGSSGVKTPISGIYTAMLVVLAFTLLTPYFPYIPKATLAAVIICAVIFMVEITIVPNIWKINRLDLVPFLLTLISCLVISIEIGILVGVLTDVVKVLYTYSKPKITVEHDVISYNPKYVVITPTAPIPFFSAENIRTYIIKEITTNGKQWQTVVIDFNRIDHMDYTTTLCMRDLIKDIRKYGKEVYVVNVPEKLVSIMKTLCGDENSVFFTYLEFNAFLSGKVDTQMEPNLKNSIENNGMASTNL